VAVVVAVVVVVVVATGCHSSVKAGRPTRDPAAADAVPAAVRTKGSVTVAVDASNPPDEFIAPDGRAIVGVDADVANTIGQVLGLRVNLVNAPSGTIIPGLLSGKFDVAASSLADTREREKQVDFVTYLTSGEGFFTAASDKTTFDGLGSLCGHSVAVQSGTSEQSGAEAQVKACQGAGQPADNVFVFQDQNAVNQAVSSGRAEVGFTSSPMAGYAVAQSKGRFKLSGAPFATSPLGIAVPKNGLATAVLAAIKALMSRGTYRTILERWNVQAGAITKPVINGAIS
jgi:polar amino acid transport system substrate-binding protein